MGEVSGKLADLTIITSDNPRFEKPEDIMADIVTGIEKTDGKYIEICDRKEAIAYAISHGEPGEITLREDSVTNFDGKEQTLANVPEQREGCPVVPKTV